MSEAAARAPRVVALGADLMFGSRLASVVSRSGGHFAQARDAEQLRRALADSGRDDPHPNPLPEGEGAEARAEVSLRPTPTLVLIDLGARGLDLAAAVSAAREAGADLVVAYGPHKDVAARRRALDAGCDRWLANSRLFEALPALISRGSGT